MLYVIWSVYSSSGVAKFYVVNQDSKAVQSVWNSLIEAKQVAASLNLFFKETG